MILAAYMVAGFAVASVYAVGILRGRRDRYHRLGFAIPFALAALATPVQLVVGDVAARSIAHDQPSKFAAMEYVLESGPKQTEYVGGVLVNGRVRFAVPIPGLDSILVGFSPGTVVKGLDQVPPDERPPSPTLLHLAFDTMVGIGTALLGLSAWFALSLVAPAVASRFALVLARGGGGRRRGDRGARVWLGGDRGWPAAVDRLPGHAHRGGCHQRRGHLDLAHPDRPALRGAGRRHPGGTARVVATLAPRGAGGRGPLRTAGGRGSVSRVDAVTLVLWLNLVIYAVFGGADFGAGLWDLFAGGAEHGVRPREFIERILTPVWEANHVWLIFMLVITWTAFPGAFASIMSTLYVPLSLAALGIVLRGSGFAFRHVATTRPRRRALGVTFALSSLLTPFFMGTVAGAIATGRVPAAGTGDRLTSWFNVTSVGIGVLLVASCGYLAAVFLVSDARRRGDEGLESYFRVRALAAGLAAGVLAALDVILLRVHARTLFEGLVGDALPLVILSALSGIAALLQLARRGAGTRALAIVAIGSVIFGWGVAQRPDILPGALTIERAAAPAATLDALLIVGAAAVAVVVPALAMLLTLHQRALLEGTNERT